MLMPQTLEDIILTDDCDHNLEKTNSFEAKCQSFGSDIVILCICEQMAKRKRSTRLFMVS